jgi:hypothetical protein
MELSGHGLFKAHPAIILERLKKIMRNFNQDSQSSGQKSNLRPPKYEGVLL